MVGTIILLELAAVALYLWWRWRERQEMAALTAEVAEERSVIFDRPPRPPREPRPTPGPRRDRHDPVEAYLLALEALATDERWARRPAETPRHHAARLGSGSSAPFGRELGRLAAAYQLIRYGARPISDRERARAAGRLERLQGALRH